MWLVALVAALSGCSNEQPTLGAPAPPPAPAGVEPVRGAVVQSELRRAVAAMEDHRNAKGTYAQSPAALSEHGFASGQVLIFVPYADKNRYCIEATSSTDTTLVFNTSQTVTVPRQGNCPEG